MKPPLQNVPLRTETGRRVREALHSAPECELMKMVREVNEDPLPGRVMQMPDFCALELRVLANLGITAEDILRK